MDYKLSNETRRNIKCTTGYDYATLTTSPLASFHAMRDSSAKHLSPSRQATIIKPRGSIYLQLGRVISVSKIKKMFFK